MALKQNKDAIMAAISAASTGKAPIGERPIKERAHRSLPKGTVGSVRAGLGGIQEIDPKLILGWGPQDRLELTAVNSEGIDELVESIKQSGQQVPVLLRPDAEHDGHFEIIYGRRRVLACRLLEVPVKALIRTLDDNEALIAKGLENATRRDLSYYERARFAEAILGQGHTREEAMQALAVSKNTLSQLERITRHVPTAVGDAIGAASGVGRPKWMALAAAFEAGKLAVPEVMARLSDVAGSSDERLEAALALATRRGTQDRAAQREPVPGVVVKSGAGTFAVTVKRSGQSKEFAEWFEANIDALLKDSYQAFKKGQGGGPS